METLRRDGLLLRKMTSAKVVHPSVNLSNCLKVESPKRLSYFQIRKLCLGSGILF